MLLSGEYDLQGLVEALEGQLECSGWVEGGSVSWICGDSDSAGVLVPAVGVDWPEGYKSYGFGGYEWVATEVGEWGIFRGVYSAAAKRRGAVRVSVFVVDESSSAFGDVRIGSLGSLDLRRGWSSAEAVVVSSSGDVDVGTVVSVFDGLWTFGVENEFEDQRDVRVRRTTSTGESDAVFESDFVVVSAGVSLRGLVFDLGGVYRVSGELELSDFLEGGEVPDVVRRVMSVGLDVPAGSLVRLAQLSVRRRGGGFAWSSDWSSRLSASRSDSRFGVWLGLERVF